LRTEDLRDYWKLRRDARNAWETVRFRKTRRPDGVLEVRWRDGRPPLFVPGGGMYYHVFHRIFLRDEYRIGRRGWGCVLDLGANLGFFSARVAPRAQRVIAYEPMQINWDLLRRNTTGFAHVEGVRAGVAAARGRVRLDFATGACAGGDVAGETIETVSLDDVFAAHEIGRCDLLKIDVEGMEYEILDAASPEVLGRIAEIRAEYHDVKPDDPRTRINNFEAFLCARGFAVEVVPHPRKPNHGMLFATRERGVRKRCGTGLDA
jgi:FkbM family methyltransferase